MGSGGGEGNIIQPKRYSQLATEADLRGRGVGKLISSPKHVMHTYTNLLLYESKWN